jgi:predicted phage terminase large subunit-like protein
MGASEKPVEIRPQAGPQTEFLGCPADIVVYGGAAGGGKSHGLLMDPLRHKNNPEFGGVIFRRTTPMIRNEGGLWDSAMSLYGGLGWLPRQQFLDFTAPSGMRIKFAHLEHETDVLGWQGAQIPFIGFDELTHFTRYQFFYMLTRNRSTCGVLPYIRCTTNPDPDSWVAEFLEWWIDQDEKSPRYGLPILSRAGVIRWFYVVNDKLEWGASAAELERRFPELAKIAKPKSVTFIPSKLSDNKILMEKDPGYLANLLAQDLVTRARLLDGNWKIRAAAGLIFKRHWFEIVDAVPPGCIDLRHWDRAATEVKPGEKDRARVGEKKKKADWTAGCKMLYHAPTKIYYIADMRHEQLGPGGVERLVRTTATQDGIRTPVSLEQEPGASGVADIHHMRGVLDGFAVMVLKPTTDKITRAGPLSSQAEFGYVKLLRGAWNEAFLKEAENFPDGENDDQVDGATGAHTQLQKRKGGGGRATSL